MTDHQLDEWLPPGAGGVSRVGYLFDAVRVRPGGRVLLSIVAFALFMVGAGMVAYPFVTNLYTQQVVQAPLQERFVEPELREVYVQEAVPPGDALTRIRIPSLGVEAIVVEGTTPEALRAGAGHYTETPLPGQPGNVAIAGHRTTYGKPFNRIDELRPGDVIELETPVQRHTYRVLGHDPGLDGCPNGACWITAPTDWAVVEPTGGLASLLTLTTCHPKGSAARRLIVRAELVETAERSAA